MRAVVQRVTEARVTVDSEVVGSIESGACIFVGVQRGDDERDVELLVRKVTALRFFEDEAGKMNLSLRDVGGAVLAVSQFTLLGDARRGNRPSFSEAMEPEPAQRLFEAFCQGVRAEGLKLETGRFRAEMRVHLVNDGPVTLLLDTKKSF